MCVLASLHIYWHRSGCRRCSEASPKYPCKVFIAKKRSPVIFDCYVMLVAVSHSMGVSVRLTTSIPFAVRIMLCYPSYAFPTLEVSFETGSAGHVGCTAFVHRVAASGDLLQKGWTWRHLTSPFSPCSTTRHCAISYSR